VSGGLGAREQGVGGRQVQLGVGWRVVCQAQGRLRAHAPPPACGGPNPKCEERAHRRGEGARSGAMDSRARVCEECISRGSCLRACGGCSPSHLCPAIPPHRAPPKTSAGLWKDFTLGWNFGRFCCFFRSASSFRFSCFFPSLSPPIQPHKTVLTVSRLHALSIQQKVLKLQAAKK
jgi:hypothetical protein